MKYSVTRSAKATSGHLYLDITEDSIEAIVNDGMMDDERAELMIGLFRYLKGVYGVDQDVFEAVWEKVPNKTETKKALVVEAIRQHPTMKAEQARLAMLKVLEKFPDRTDICSLWAKSLEWEAGEDDIPVMNYKSWKQRYDDMKAEANNA